MEISILRLNLGIFLVLLFSSMGRAQLLSQEYKDKKAIIYQGSTYLVTGGCSPPRCNEELKECQRIQNAFRNLYSYCMQSAHGNYPACLRDKINFQSSINVPIYASVCDAFCHESDPEKLLSLTVCQSPAEQDEELSNHFGK